jgi:hypothetical protein
VLTVVLTGLALALGVPILETFLQIHKVPRFPTAILATGLVMLAALSLMSGLILDTVTRGRREARRLRYLSLSGPLTHYPSIPVSDDLPINEATPWVRKGTSSEPSDPH